MKLSIDTEIEEIAELKASIAIIEDAIKRREGFEENSNETQTTVPTQDNTTKEEFSEPVEQEPIQQQEPVAQPETKEAPLEVDLSALATSDYGERVEKRSMDAQDQPIKNNKETVKGIIQNLKEQSGGNPIQMQDIINHANEKNINEDETRKLVNELQSSSSL